MLFIKRSSNMKGRPKINILNRVALRFFKMKSMPHFCFVSHPLLLPHPTVDPSLVIKGHLLLYDHMLPCLYVSGHPIACVWKISSFLTFEVLPFKTQFKYNFFDDTCHDPPVRISCSLCAASGVRLTLLL